MYNIGEDYIRRLRSNKNQLYKELKPKVRIGKIIIDHIQPNISTSGFKFVKSRMQLERTIGDFKQAVCFRTSINNYKDEVANFEVQLKVENKEYIQHCIEHYDYKIINFISTQVAYLDLWDQDFYDGWYRLQLDDNRKIANKIADNISYCTQTYLDIHSDYESSLRYRIEQFKTSTYFALLLIPDILILSKITNRLDVKEKIIKAYENWKLTEAGQKDLKDGASIFDTIEKIKSVLS